MAFIRKGVVAGKATAKTGSRLSPTQRKTFLAQLGESSNVAESAKAAGVHSRVIYAERQQSAAFCTAWIKALKQGYARLEADLLAEALRAASGNSKPVTLTSRAQKNRLGMLLLNAHRDAVRGEGKAPKPLTRASAVALRARFEQRYALIAARLKADNDD
jgi:DNA-binding protein H-NS